MNVLLEIEERLRALLTEEPYRLDVSEHQEGLLALLKAELAYACDRNRFFRNYVEAWPVHYQTSKRIADLPFVPVGVFKSNPPLSLVEGSEITRVLASSATTGQVPSRVVLDSVTARRMTKGVMMIIRDFIGSNRRPYLVVDTPAALASNGELGARGAAIQGLRSFATEIICCLSVDADGNLRPEGDKLFECAKKWKDAEVLVYGFTYVIWNHLVKPLQSAGVCLDLPNVRVLHSGGWKRLQQEAVGKEAFAQGVATTFGCSPDRVIDFYGMVENVGVVYPDCDQGNKHVPAFADVIIRNVLTLEPVTVGQQGLVQVSSVLPTSFPGFLLLTEDIAELIHEDGCPCGRRGRAFRFIGRAPKAEVRGCGNLEVRRA
jgi:phenylacetate-coenzyme A ligase PaaK-like adenylate-forming protein